MKYKSDSKPLAMQLKKGQSVEFDIHTIAFGGAGLGKYEGLSVFVHGTMPGDRVKAAFTRIKENFAEADLIEIVKPSSDRVCPRCKYANVCGGCDFQFMPYEKQLEIKKQQVMDSFERIGKIYDPPVAEIIGCKETFYYRNKMEFSFGYDEQMIFALGMHVPERRYDVMDLEECFLESEFSVKILNAIRDFCVSKKWQPFQFSCGKGFLQSLYIREGKRTNEVLVNLVTSDQIPSDFENGIEDFVGMLLELSDEKNEAKKITSIYWSEVINKKGQRKEIKEHLVYGKKMLSEKMILKNGDSLSFDISPQAFFQVNTFQAEILYSEVTKLASENNHETVFDLFCGTGTIGLFLAKHCGEVFGIELNEESVKAARENAQKNKIFNIDFFTGDVSKLLYSLRARPSLIVVDPPRAGLTEKIIKKINEFSAKQIIYVSCNPTTLARDCQWFLSYGYKTKSIQPVDMFPHSYHIECVCLLER